MKNRIIKTSNSWTPFLLRLMVGIVIFPHGAQKLMGWYGGYGFEGTMQFFTETVGLPWIVGFSVILIEVFGSIAIILGLTTRIFAFSYIGLAIGIMFSRHVQYGFFMNWFGNQGGEGFEFFLLWIAIAISLLITGGGRYSVDKEFIQKEVTA